MESTRRKSPASRAFIYLVLAIYVVVALAPMYWMALTSFRTEKQIHARDGMLLPTNLTLQAYRYTLVEKSMLTWLGNSFMVASATVALSLGVDILGAYALARLRFPGRNFLARLLVCTYLVPASLLFIPMFMILSRVGLLDNQAGLVVAYLSFSVPFGTWLLFGYFNTIPQEIEDAARIDGCSYYGVLGHVVIPLAMPGIVVTAIFCFTDAWNEFMYAAVLISSTARRTAPLGMTEFKVGDYYQWGPMMAAGLLTTIPAIVLFMFAQRFVVKGLSAGAVKG